MKIKKQRITASSRRSIKADTLSDGRQVSEGSLHLDVIEKKLSEMIGKPVKDAANLLYRYGFDNTELNGADGTRKTTGIDSYDTWAGYENNDGYYVKLYYTMERDRKRGGNAFAWGILTDFYVDRYDVEASTRTRKTPIKADAADVYENSDDTFEELYFDVCINDNHNGSYYEREEDAIDVASEYAANPQYADDEITVVLEHYMTDARGEIIDYFDDNGAVIWSSNDAIYDSTSITCAADANGYEDLALALGDAIKKLAADEDHLNNFISYLTQHFPEWLRKYANTPDGLVSEFREFANMNF